MGGPSIEKGAQAQVRAGFALACTLPKRTHRPRAVHANPHVAAAAGAAREVSTLKPRKPAHVPQVCVGQPAATSPPPPLGPGSSAACSGLQLSPTKSNSSAELSVSVG